MHSKLRSAPVIYLVGFMGCGKSTIGQRLAEKLGWPFVDLDQEIERRAGRSITALFEECGEPRFRDLEHEALREQARLARFGKPRVVALGGGAFAEPRNRQCLADEGVSIWLDCPLETLWRRVSESSHRPLARDRSMFETLYRQRMADYQSADFTFDPDGDDPDRAVERILAIGLLR